MRGQRSTIPPAWPAEVLIRGSSARDTGRGWAGSAGASPPSVVIG
jgi:hypothetical protein